MAAGRQGCKRGRGSPRTRISGLWGSPAAQAVAYSGGCCGEQTSLRTGLGPAFPGSQPLEAALLQLLSFPRLG